jgi:hypothetical protein
MAAVYSFETSEIFCQNTLHDIPENSAFQVCLTLITFYNSHIVSNNFERPVFSFPWTIRVVDYTGVYESECAEQSKAVFISIIRVEKGSTQLWACKQKQTKQVQDSREEASWLRYSSCASDLYDKDS